MTQFEAQAGLSRLRVLDLSRFVSGPYTTKLLAGYGADVVKVEPPGGDPGRRVGPFPKGSGPPQAGALFRYLHASKRSITLDLDQEQGRALLLRLLPAFDVLVENFAPGYLDALGLDEPALLERQSALVITRITPFGSDGPRSTWRATDFTLQATSGMAHHNGEPDREPLKLYGYQAYYLGGAHAAVASLGALRRRRATGEAQTVDVSIAAAARNVIVPSLTSYAYDGSVTIRRGSGRGAFAVYPCADGAASISVYHTGREWGDFVEMVGGDALADPKFRTPYGRNEHMEELESEILGWTVTKTKDELVELGRAHRIAVGPGATIDDLLSSPQLRAREFFVEGDEPGELLPGPPARLERSPWTQRPAAGLGEHNTEVYRGELGMSDGDLDRLRALGAI